MVGAGEEWWRGRQGEVTVGRHGASSVVSERVLREHSAIYSGAGSGGATSAAETPRCRRPGPVRCGSDPVQVITDPSRCRRVSNTNRRRQTGQRSALLPSTLQTLRVLAETGGRNMCTALTCAERLADEECCSLVRTVIVTYLKIKLTEIGHCGKPTIVLKLANRTVVSTLHRQTSSECKLLSGLDIYAVGNKPYRKMDYRESGKVKTREFQVNPACAVMDSPFLQYLDLSLNIAQLKKQR